MPSSESRCEDISFLEKLVSTYSPTGREAEANSLVKGYMMSRGFRGVRVDAAGNVLGEVGAGYPTVLLYSHVDTVEGELPVRMEGGRLYGRGAVDAKGPLAAMVCGLAGYEGMGRVVVCSSVGEEGESRGVAHLCSQPRGADLAVFGEPTGLRAAAYAHRGSLTVEVVVRGRGGHPASPWGYANPVEEFYALLRRLREALGEGGSRDHFLDTSVAVTGIHGEGGSKIPEECRAQVNIRFPPPSTPTQVYGRVEEAVSSFSDRVRAEARFLEGSEPYVAPKDSALVEGLRRAVRRRLGTGLLLVRKAGTSDMGALGRAWGMPVVTYGPGDPRLSHTRQESISTEEFRAACEIYRTACEEAVNILLDKTP